MKVTVEADVLKLMVDIVDQQSWEVRKNMSDDYFTDEQRRQIARVDEGLNSLRKQLRECGL